MSPAQKRLLIYTDGACSGNPGPGGWGAIVSYPEGRVRELGGSAAATTNNRMEMTAAIAALRAVEGQEGPVCLYTDSTYLISGATSWLASWKRKAWTRGDGGAVLNRDLWEELEALTLPRGGGLSWNHVRGHEGHGANERCDEIAVSLAQGRSPTLYDGPAARYAVDLTPPAAAARPGAPARRRKAPKHGFYLSLVAGRVERHPTWAECRARVSGVSGARFKKVAGAEEEKSVLRSWGRA